MNESSPLLCFACSRSPASSVAMFSASGLTPAQVNHLLTLLAPESVDSHPVEALSSRLASHFSRPEAFKVGLALTHLLQHPDLVPAPPQRLAALVFLHDLFRNEPFNLNPFLAVFVHFLFYEGDDEGGGGGGNTEEDPGSLGASLCGVKLSTVERQFVTLLVTGGAKDWLKKTAKYVNMFYWTTKALLVICASCSNPVFHLIFQANLLLRAHEELSQR